MLRTRPRARGGSSSGGGGDAPFSPTDLAGLVQWNDASDSATVTHSSNNVSQWDDKSGNSRNFTAAGGARPIYDGVAGTISFNGSSHIMTHSDPIMYASGACTVFMVAAVPAQAGGRNFLCEYNNGVSAIESSYYVFRQPTDGGSATYCQCEAFGTPFFQGIFSSLMGNTVMWTGDGSTLSAYAFKDSGSELTIRKDGTDGLATASYSRAGKTCTPNRMALGARANTGTPEQFGEMDLCELLIWSRVLTADEIGEVEEYLDDKWGLTLAFLSIENRAYQARKQVIGADGFGFNTPKILGTNARNFRVGFKNYYYGPGGESNTGNSYDIENVSLVAPNGTAVPVFFSGSRSLTVADGEQGILSDPIAAADFGYSLATRGDTFWVKGLIGIAASGYMPDQSNAYKDVTDSQTFFYTKASTTPSTVDASGPFSFTGATPTQEGMIFCPILIGQPEEKVPVWFCVADSIAWGYGDNEDRDGYGRGYFQLAMQSSSAVNGPYADPIPSGNWAKGGSQTDYYTGLNTKWTYWAQFANRGYEALGTNDVADNTQPVFEAQIDEIWDAMRAAGHEKIVSGAVMCFTTSTDVWATTANQTILNSNWDTGGKKDTINAYKAASLGSKIDRFIAFNSLLDETNPNKWKANGVAGFMVGDGVHPSYNDENGEMGGYYCADEFRAVRIALG